MEKLVLIDGNSLLNRAFYATPAFTNKEGVPTNGVFGFVKLLLKIISDKKPTYLAVAFDVHAPTFRHKKYAEYKAGRKPMPEELRVQFPILKEVLTLMNIKICELAGFEADDIIGTLAKKFAVQTYIYTGDRDAYQLVDETTNVCYTRKGVSDILELSFENFKDEIGLIPSQIIDLKALMGDKSDHIPGIAGIGEKTAMGLLESYKDLDGIYANLDDIKGATNKKLSEGKEDGYFSKELATIEIHAPVEVALSECIVKMPFSHSVQEKFAELDFKSLVGKDIFLKSEEKAEKKEISIKEIHPKSIEEGMAILNGFTSKTFAFSWEESEIRFVNVEKNKEEVTEYVFPIMRALIDLGYFESQLKPIFEMIFAKGNKVILYNAKNVMKKLMEIDASFEADYDDVSILKCLSEGLGNTDGLSFCLNYFGIPEQHKAYGLTVLYEDYYSNLNEQEKKLYEEIELPLVKVLFNMEKEGVCVDEKCLDEISNRYETELKSIIERIYELAGETFNINSTQQLGNILFEKLHIGAGKTKDGKKRSTSAEELEKYVDDHEIIPYLLRYRKIQKLKSTYLDGFKPLIRNGKVHTTYSQSNTQTGRLSSLNPNLQNIPVRTEEGKELRKMFVASEGNVLIDADYSQIELRLLAHFSNCKALIKAYCNGEDIHSVTAGQVFNVKTEEVTSSMRRVGKAVNFGIIYGISAYGLSRDLNISAKQAKEYIDRYFETYPEVKIYMNENVEKAKTDGYVTTLYGRRRVINEIRSSNFNLRSFGERAAMNMPLQGSNADIIKVAMINVTKRLKEEGYKAKLVLQVHDELVIDCPKAEADNVAKILKEEMENVTKLSLPLTVDVNYGQNWFETK